MKKILILIALTGTLVPAAFVLREAGGLENWRGVMPGGTTDSRYYYARIHEVADGHPFIGNPYAFEHREAVAPAFFLPDIATALPVLLGIPFDIAMVANIFLWSSVFLLLAFALLRLLSVRARWAVLWAILAYASSYSFMLRPTVMQVIYPVFLLFLIALLQFLRAPDRRRALWLAAASALTFYAYTYLAYAAFLTLGAAFAWFLFGRRFGELRALLFSGAVGALLLLPFGFNTLLQMKNTLYLETLARLGLVYTRIPTIETYYYGRWIFVSIAVFALLWFWYDRKEARAGDLFWITSGAGLLGALFLNVITGVDLALGVHIGRLAIPWVPLALGAGLHECYARGRMPEFRKTALFVCLFAILALGATASVRRGLEFFGFTARGQTVAALQAYAAPLAWFERNVPEESVIWSDDAVAQYIPIMTRHYPLFHESVVLQAASDVEIEERYLLSRSLANLTAEDLKRDFHKYAGAGAAKAQPLAHNQRVWLCNMLARIRPRACPKYIDALTMRGEVYFEVLAERFAAVKKDKTALLERYSVSYLLIDRMRDMGNLPVKRAVYDDGRFAIIPLPL